MYDYNDDFLTQNLKKFQQNQEEFQDSYTNFLEKIDFNGEKQKKRVAVSQVHLDYKEKMNYTLTDFFKISEKYDYVPDHNIHRHGSKIVGFLKQKLK